MKDQTPISTSILAHALATWTFLNVLLVWVWLGRVEGEHWVTVFGNHRLSPIPDLAWFIIFAPSLVTVVLSVIINWRSGQNKVSVVEEFIAFHLGIVFCFYSLLGWGMSWM